jgi:integrase
MATIRKRGTRWQVQVRRLGCQALSKSFLNRADAEAWARLKEVEADRGEIAKPEKAMAKTKVCQIFQRYLEEVIPKKRGADSERIRVQAFLRTGLASLSVRDLKPSHITAYRDQRLKSVSDGTVRRELALLQHCFSVAQKDWSMIQFNPVELVGKPSPSRARSRRLTDDEASRLLLALSDLKSPMVRHVFQFALATGMRRGEVLSLTWDNIDLASRVAYLPMTKNGEPRRVPLSSSARQVMLDLLEGRQRAPESLPEAFRQRVFPISANAVRLAWNRVRKKAGVHDLRFHDLRHEAISRFFELGLSVPEVALISGHKDARMLFRYTHLKAENVAKKLV